MKSTKFLSLAALTLALSLPALPARAADTYTVDKGHTEVGFQIRHLVTKVRGRFNDFSGTIVFDKAKPENSSVEFKINAASIDTGIADRDNHLRAPDFFDVEKFPEITFKSTSVKSIGGDKYMVTGPFTMHGVTKTLALTVEFSGEAPDPWGNVRAGFATSTTLPRKDYGIVWNKALDNGGVILGEDVSVDINIEAVKKKDEAKK
jgi:polyisoprenoid-binding protein YceI